MTINKENKVFFARMKFSGCKQRKHARKVILERKCARARIAAKKWSDTDLCSRMFFWLGFIRSSL